MINIIIEQKVNAMHGEHTIKREQFKKGENEGETTTESIKRVVDLCVL